MSKFQKPRTKFRRESLRDWERFISELFSFAIPGRAEWRDPESMVNVLQHLGAVANANHTFMPSGGGSDLTGASLSFEDGCIELHFGEANFNIIRPRILFFEKPSESLAWAYFRLESHNLDPSGVYEDLPPDLMRETLTELESGRYVDYGFWEQGIYGCDESGDPLSLPDNARPVNRYFRGAFVIFSKGSPYNANTGTYDGRHNRLSVTEFRRYIEESAKLSTRASEPR